MIYEPIDRMSLLAWIQQRQTATVPSIWEVEDTSETFTRVLQTQIGGLRELIDFRFDSGAVEVRFDRLPDFNTESMMKLAETIAATVDERKFFRWDGLDDEERGAPEGVARAVTDELWGSIDGVQPVGPGGRISLYGSRRRADIVVRHRAKSMGGSWRTPTAISRTADDLFGEQSAKDVRLRGTFGYFEASKFDRQRYLRPVFVFVLDRPAATDGPRWRIAAVTAASTIGDLPLTAGLETTTGGCL